jgi:hypothetical protein
MTSSSIVSVLCFITKSNACPAPVIWIAVPASTRVITASSLRPGTSQFTASPSTANLFASGTTVGAGGTAGSAVFVTAGTAVTAELIGNLFYGAATKETGYPVYPVLSLQLGLLLDQEVLP